MFIEVPEILKREIKSIEVTDDDINIEFNGERGTGIFHDGHWAGGADATESVVIRRDAYYERLKKRREELETRKKPT